MQVLESSNANTFFAIEQYTFGHWMLCNSGEKKVGLQPHAYERLYS